MDKETMIGERLTRLRHERRQTRAFVAEKTGIAYSTLTAYESGLRHVSDKNKVRLAEYYGMPVGNLFFSEDYH